MDNKTLTKELCSFIDNSPSMFHTAETSIKILEQNGFTRLEDNKPWTIALNGKYYTEINHSCVIAFTINSTNVVNEGFKIVGTHGDAPTFKIKPAPQISKDGYVMLNTEGYGGALLSTWFDRPLSIAGRVSTINNDNLLRPHSHLVNIDRPILTIPSLAIHMNRDANNGHAIDKQKETLPLLTLSEKPASENMLLDLIAKTLGIKVEEILDYDLYLYPYEKALLVGLEEELISTARLDNLSMAYSALHSIINASSSKGINVYACFDNEEVGSTTKQGAASPFLIRVLERILVCLGFKNREDLFVALNNSFLVSADVAHLVHPNYMEKSDPTNKVLPGKGVAIKMSANQSYTSDSDSSAVFAGICQKNNVPYQKFVNRSDMRGGSTIGPIATTQLGIRSVDIGTPMLAMHSARELMTVDDYCYTVEAMQAFYNL